VRLLARCDRDRPASPDEREVVSDRKDAHIDMFGICASGGDAFAAMLVERAAALRLPSLFCRPRSDAVHQVVDRHGVSVAIVETQSLSDEELTAILRFRLAQYLAAGFADADLFYERNLEHEPLASVAPSDLHVVAGSAAEGEILCYLTLRSCPSSCQGQRMRSRARPPFPIEEAHGIGIYNRLAGLPDLPVANVREVSRFAKAQRLHRTDELGVRGPIEVLLALLRGLVGPLRPQIDALIGEVEEDVVKRNLDFFDVPTVLVRATVPYEAQSYLNGRSGRAFYPFALSVADVATCSLDRAAEIERALELPGHEAVRRLLELKRTAAPPPSSLVPPGGLPPLANTGAQHADVAMPARLAMRKRGDELRAVPPFDRLTPGEATVLRTFMTSLLLREGDDVTRHGEAGDEVFVIQEGEADVSAVSPGGAPAHVGRLRAGMCFGEIGVALGCPRSATVVARTPMKLLRLSGDDYRRYVSPIREVDNALVRLAVTQLGNGA
jgi:Cyclic nucleotide-binding domain